MRGKRDEHTCSGIRRSSGGRWNRRADGCGKGERARSVAQGAAAGEGQRQAQRRDIDGDGRAEQRDHSGDEGHKEQTETDIAESLLRTFADGQAPRDRGGPETVGQVIRRSKNPKRIDDPGDEEAFIKVIGDGAHCAAVGVERELRAEGSIFERQHMEQHEENQVDRADPLRDVEVVLGVRIVRCIPSSGQRDENAVDGVIKDRKVDDGPFDQGKERQRMDLVDLSLVGGDAAVKSLCNRGVNKQMDDQIPAENQTRQRMKPAEQEMLLRAQKRDI